MNMYRCIVYPDVYVICNQIYVKLSTAVGTHGVLGVTPHAAGAAINIPTLQLSSCRVFSAYHYHLLEMETGSRRAEGA